MLKMPKGKQPTKREFVEIQRALVADPTSKFSREIVAPYGETVETNDVLRVVDAWCVKNGEPIPSCCVGNDLTGTVTSVFWESVDRYGLRLPGETDAQVLERIRDENKSFNDKL
ncbi:hypothetical protein [Magnetospirillum sulfuroxidans]|uniref:Uncharacterized protein n=1 Tax=Magnetospirillum sulfuroxidans TaxID=611300 RepID=A0ABS5IDF0_9PROT|nr:hypothetical protein [Magnetospirillum sulfuroxidans]MBR9972440.1 hypothetical protein [Magnetospirillum sulfuroxidans]